MEWLFQYPILFFSIVFHEYSHGWVAYRHGDDTAALQGRLTFNPLPHIDPVGTVLLPLLCALTRFPMFGWAKPVPVNASRLNHPGRDFVRVALAGPGSNLALVLGAAFLFKATNAWGVFAPGFQEVVSQALRFTIAINLFLAFFNLLPVFPLDGSQILSRLLPWRLRRRYESHYPYGFLIILVLMSAGLLRILVQTPSALAYLVLARLGLIW